MRDYDPNAPGAIYTYGGMVGEIIISLFCLYASAIKQDGLAGFKMESEQLESFLKDLLAEGPSPGCCFLKVSEDPSHVDPETKLDEKAKSAAKHLTLPEGHQTYGMKFLLTKAQGMGIEKDFLEEIFVAFSKMHYEQPKELNQPPEGEEQTEEAKEVMNQLNEDIEKEN